jgi:hypothetical protein
VKDEELRRDDGGRGRLASGRGLRPVRIRSGRQQFGQRFERRHQRDKSPATGDGGKDPAGGDVAQASAAGALSPDFLIGRWTDTGDCSAVIEFFPDGTFTVPGGGTGRWSVVGDQLTFRGGSTQTARIAAPDANTIILTHPDGSEGRSTRCS